MRSRRNGGTPTSSCGTSEASWPRVESEGGDIPGAARKVTSSAGESAKDVLHLFEERLLRRVCRLRIHDLLRHCFGQFLEEVLLLAGQLSRHRRPGDDVEIAVPAS